jgi:trans-aconitate 2-methyltransferase
MTSVENFYDTFASQQEAMGINLRHSTIDKWCAKFELKPTDNVLEIGCGIGTQTELLSNRITNGHIDSFDISSKSIDIAKKRLNNRSNVTFTAADILNTELKKDFYDFILLPDVLEHIPIEVHDVLFKKISHAAKPKAKILIHIPDPYYNQWVSVHHPELQQIIDQNLFMPLIVKQIYDAGLCIEYLKTYDLHANNGDYQVILLRKVRDKVYSPVIRSKTLFSKIVWKLGSLFK